MSQSRIGLLNRPLPRVAAAILVLGWSALSGGEAVNSLLNSSLRRSTVAIPRLRRFAATLGMTRYPPTLGMTRYPPTLGMTRYPPTLGMTRYPPTLGMTRYPPTRHLIVALARWR